MRRMAVEIRAYTSADQPGVEAIDTSFTTPTIFELVVEPRRLELVERAQPHAKTYPIEDAFAFWASWKTAWVAVDAGRVVGFAAVEYEAWHTRLILWHLYVDPSHRRAGIARQLLARCEDHARSKGATHVWLETSNVNVPGIRAYERLGYALCGVDQLYYQSLEYAHEQAVYLAKRL